MAGSGTFAVLGGGISGLTAAYRLAQTHPAPKRIVLLEGSARIGGWITTTRNSDGVIYECGPRTMRPAGDSGMACLNLVHDLGLSEQVMSVPFGHPSSRNRYVYVDSNLVRLPTDLSALFKTSPPFKRPLIAAGLRDLFTSKSNKKDESMYDFVSRRLGPDIAEFAIDPLVRGICAGDAREISVNFLLKSFKESEQEYGRIFVGEFAKFRKRSKNPTQQVPLSDLAKKAKLERWPVWSLEGGLQTFPETLAEKAAEAGVELFVESPCTGLEFQKDGSVVVKCAEGELVASKVISALPAHKLAPVLQQSHPALTTMLNSIKSVTVGMVNLEWPGKILPYEAFGFLVPSTQGLPILGAVFDTCSFSQGDRTIVTVMMGGRWFESLFGKNPTKEDLYKVAITQIRDVLNIQEPPRRSQVHIHQECIPQYVVGHIDRVKEIRQYIKENKLNIDLIGASFDGVSVNDCVYYAEKAVEMAQSK